MRNTISKILVMIVFFAGCTKNNPGEPAENDLQIRAQAAVAVIASGAQSKAPVSDNGVPVNNLKALVVGSADQADYSTLYSNGTMTFNGASAIEYDKPLTAGSSSIPLGPLYLTAFYPDNGWTLPSATTGATRTFTGTEDIMAAPQVVVDKTASIPVTVAGFTFDHLLTRLDIIVKASGDAAIGVWGDVTEITVKEAAGTNTFCNEVNVNAASANAAGLAPTTTAFSGNEIVWKTYRPADDVVFAGQSMALETAPVSVAAYTMMAPFVVQGTEDIVLTVTTVNGGSKDIAVDFGNSHTGEDTQGKAYTITLNFLSREIAGTATITPWQLITIPPVEVE